MYQYRQILVRLRQGDTDRQIARARLMGRRKLAVVRVVAHEHGWLDPQAPLPADAELAAVFSASTAAGPVSLAPWCEPIRQWQAAGIQGTTIHAALVREHGYSGSYSTVYRLLRRLAAERGVEVPLRLEFAPGEGRPGGLRRRTPRENPASDTRAVSTGLAVCPEGISENKTA